MRKMTNKKTQKIRTKSMRKIYSKKPGSQKNFRNGKWGGVSTKVSPKNGNYLIPLFFLKGARFYFNKGPALSLF